MEGLFKAANMDDEECASLGIEAITEVLHIGYEYLTSYIQAIGELTFSLMARGRNKQVSAILFFW